MNHTFFFYKMYYHKLLEPNISYMDYGIFCEEIVMYHLAYIISKGVFKMGIKKAKQDIKDLMERVSASFDPSEDDEVEVVVDPSGQANVDTYKPRSEGGRETVFPGGGPPDHRDETFLALFKGNINSDNVDVDMEEEDDEAAVVVKVRDKMPEQNTNPTYYPKK